MYLSLSPKLHRFPVSIINQAVWHYHRFNNSYRDIQEQLLFRGMILQAFNGQNEAAQKIVDNSAQMLVEIYNPKLNVVFGDYKKPQYIQKYCF